MLEAKIEAILFIVAKPLTIKKLADFLEVKPKEVAAAIEELSRRLNGASSGLRLARSGDEVQLMTSPECAGLVRNFVKDEISGELTRPQLETLTVIAYRQPVTKPELEQIRGVNCSLIIRNLLMRGLIEEEEAKEKLGLVYRVSHEFLRFLGLSEVRELPDYEKLHLDQHLISALEQLKSASPKGPEEK